MKDILCKKCATWVDCGKKNGETYGFCLQESLFSYTARTLCNDYLEGKPMSECEFDYYNKGGNHAEVC